jgi:hypothetical protein
MDADDSLKTIEKKLQVVQCNNRERVLLASHQLTRSAADWLDAFVEAHEGPNTINWNEFNMSFHSHHVPQGVIKLKKKEFQDQKRGSMMLSKNVTHFTQLSRYAPNDLGVPHPGMELDEVLDESDTMPFLGEAAIMIVYGGCPPPGRGHVSNLSPGTSTRCDQGHGDIKAQVFQYPSMCVCVNVHLGPLVGFG